MKKLRRFRRNQKLPTMLAQLNALVDAVNALTDIRDDGLIQVRRSSTGLSLSLNIAAIRPRVVTPVVRFAKVVAMYEQDGTVFADPPDTWISHVTANPCLADGADVNTDTTLYLKASGDADEDEWCIGFGDTCIAVDDIVAYLPGDGHEVIQGLTDTTYYDGYIIPWAGSSNIHLIQAG